MQPGLNYVCKPVAMSFRGKGRRGGCRSIRVVSMDLGRSAGGAMLVAVHGLEPRAKYPRYLTQPHGDGEDMVEALTMPIAEEVVDVSLRSTRIGEEGRKRRRRIA